MTPGVSLGGQYSFFSSEADSADSIAAFVVRPQVEVGYRVTPRLRAGGWVAFRMAFFSADDADTAAAERSLLGGIAVRYLLFARGAGE